MFINKEDKELLLTPGETVTYSKINGDYRVEGDPHYESSSDFLTHKKTRWNQPVEELEAYKGAGHGGGDWGLVRDFVLAVHHQDPTYLSSTVDDSVESHVMGFKAEESRLSDKKIKFS